VIITITLNPALDRTLTVPSIRFNDVLRAKEVRHDWGGKGFNVSRALQALGARSLVMGLVGGTAGNALECGLADLGLETDLVQIEGNTRTNTVITELDTGRYIKVNEPGAEVQAGELAYLEDRIRERLHPDDWWILSGSLPPGAPPDYYAHLVKLIHSEGARALVDTSGLPLALALEAQPFLVKPNAEEAGEIMGQAIEDDTDAMNAADLLLERGVSFVALSLGAGGMLFATKKQKVLAIPPRAQISSPVGAGDALLAGIVWAMTQGLALEETACWGVASGTAAAMCPGSGIGTRSQVEGLLAQTSVQTLYPCQ
jgi:1-phosphofructokinase family hexose kinase